MIDNLSIYLVRAVIIVIAPRPAAAWWLHPDAQGICADIAQCLLTQARNAK